MVKLGNVFSQKFTKTVWANHSDPWILLFVPKIATETSLNAFQNANKISQIQIKAILMPTKV